MMKAAILLLAAGASADNATKIAHIKTTLKINADLSTDCDDTTKFKSSKCKVARETLTTASCKGLLKMFEAKATAGDAKKAYDEDLKGKMCKDAASSGTVEYELGTKHARQLAEKGITAKWSWSFGKVGTDKKAEALKTLYAETGNAAATKTNIGSEFTTAYNALDADGKALFSTKPGSVAVFSATALETEYTAKPAASSAVKATAASAALMLSALLFA